jgi:carbonic anhydrase/acetyltransferase-like protein (isoleucine patch superfamily)
LVTIALTHVEDPWNYGIAQLEGNGCIERFHEKPDKEKCFSDLASTGIYMVDPRAMDFVPEKISFDFAKDLFHLLHVKKRGSMFGYELEADNFWADVGQPEGFLKAMEWMLKRARRDVMIGDNVEITSSGIIGPTVIGNSVVVEENCTVGPHTVLFDDVYIARNSALENCFIGEQTITGENASIKGAIIGAHCELGNDVEVLNGKIWPYVTIPHSTTVDSTIKRYVSFNGGEKYEGNDENEDLLRTVPDEEAFYFNMRKGGKIVHTGFIAHSLKEFLEILDKIDLKAIEYHLREGCNDFAAWIRDVFRHNKLAEEVAEMQWWWPRKKLSSRILKRLSEG